MTNAKKFEEVFNKAIHCSKALEPQMLALRSAHIDGVDCMEEWLNSEYINKSEDKEVKEKQTPEDYKRELLMHKLSEMPDEIIEAAYLWAVNYIAYGLDVTKEWPTVVHQTQALETAYRKGYYDAMKDMKERDKE